MGHVLIPKRMFVRKFPLRHFAKDFGAAASCSIWIRIVSEERLLQDALHVFGIRTVGCVSSH